jgi:hypothetical protein
MGLWQKKKRKTNVESEAVTIKSSKETSNMDSTKVAVLIEQGDELMCNVSNSVANTDASTADLLIPIGEYDGIMLYFLPILGVPIPATCSNRSSTGVIQRNTLKAEATTTTASQDAIIHDRCFIELLHPDSHVLPTAHLSTGTTPSKVHSTSAKFNTNIDLYNNDPNTNTDSLEHLIPHDRVNQAIFHTSIWLAKQIVHLSEQGAKLLKDQGKKWRASQPDLTAIVLIIEEEQPQQTHALGTYNQEMNPSSSNNITNHCDTDTSNIHVRNASYIWSCSKAVRNAVEYVSESISNLLGTMIGSCITEQPTDGEIIRYSRHLVRTTVVSCGEVGTSIEESFDIITHATKEEVTSCVALYYGRDAATCTQHTLGTVINLLKAVITARRVLNAKKVAQFSIAKASATSTLN